MIRILNTLALLLLGACSSPEIVDNANSTFQDAGSDAALDSATDSATADGDTDGASAVDAATDAGESFWVSPDDISLWMQDRSCDGPGRTVEQVWDGPFEMPDTAHRSLRITRTEIEEMFGSPLPPSKNAFVDTSLTDVVDDLQYDIFVEPGDDLVFYTYLTSTYGPDIENHYMVTPMLDYESVEVDFTRFSDDRTEIIDATTDTGIAFESTGVLDIIDIRIPAAHFTPGRMHEVAIAIRGEAVQLHKQGITVRFQVWYGGVEPPSDPLPCVVPELDDEITDFERAIFNGGATVARIFTIPNPRMDNDFIRDARPGETVRIYSSIYAFLPNPERAFEVMFWPTLDGRPIGEPWWRSYRKSDQGRNFEIDDRHYFDVTLPDEPGIYQVALKAYEDPWVRWRAFGSDVRNDHVANRGVNEGSNVLRFRVTEP